ncbi:MAG: hypothetical protein O2854_05635 [Chloroflexi bacterium]|nr:hypothetical protein [Chloroflexota bacterium]
MSKLTDKLEKVGQQTAAPLGFGSASKKDAANPALMIIGRGTPAELSKKTATSGDSIDAYVVELSSWTKATVEKVATALKDKVWGVRIPSITEDQTAALKKLGGDFAVLDIGTTPAAVLNDEDIGIFVTLGPDLDEDDARAIHELPMDGIFFRPHKDLFPVTMKSLLALLKTRSYIDKFLIMEAPASLTQGDLETLRNIGAAAIATDAKATKELKATKTAIVNLPKPKTKGRDRSIALVPQSAHSHDEHSHDHDDDDYEDDEDY